VDAGGGAVRSVWWDGGTVRLLDQTLLPHQVQVRTCQAWEEVAEAIRHLRVRGAPAIGAAAAYALALAAWRGQARTPEALAEVAAALAAARPTAVNLRWALDRLLTRLRTAPADADPARVLLDEAEAVAREDLAANARIAEFGAALIAPGERILTYCNTGSLATVGGGTAYGILRRAHAQGKGIRVLACETRPVLQGARLTAWELQRDGIPFALLTDNAAGWLMARGEVDRVLVGADRVARNGDVANKIGTYTLAVLARAHGIPFVVAAPRSTFDPRLPDGKAIPIEERPPEEVLTVAGRPIAPEGTPARNPAFDVTPHHLVTALVTDAGVLHPPLGPAIDRLLGPAASPGAAAPPEAPPAPAAPLEVPAAAPPAPEEARTP